MDPLAKWVEVLDAMSGPSWVEGVERLARTLEIRADNESIRIDDLTLADWLIARSERAPYGDSEGTRYDDAVRSTLRLKTRGATEITGMDVAGICRHLEAAFATDRQIVATLHDILVYPVGGKFARHKDTPASFDQLGSLVIDVPSPHEGGSLMLDDGTDNAQIDWSGTIGSDELRWVAIYGDVDHEIAPVVRGARITIVYSLSLGGPRRDEGRRAAIDEMTDAIVQVTADASTPRDFVVPCRHMVIVPRDTPTYPLPIESLRGDDRVIADAFTRSGGKVEVVELLTVGDDDAIEHDASAPSLRRVPPLGDTLLVTKPIPDEVFRNPALTIDSDPGGWEDEEMTVGVLAPYATWRRIKPVMVVRKKARAVLAFKGLWSATGYFGNEYGYAYVYRIVALRVVLAA